jgi:hypothetical protein
MKCDTIVKEDAVEDFGISTFRVSEVEETRNSTNRIREIAKPEILKRKEKSRFGKGHDHTIKVRRFE